MSQPNTSAYRAVSTKEDPTGAFYVLSSTSSAPRGRPPATGDAVEMLVVVVAKRRRRRKGGGNVLAT